jgi:C1A family cysteine protease
MADRVYGWLPDAPDSRDQRFSLQRLGLRSQPLPEHVDLRLGCPPVRNQGALGSCTAQAICAAIEFDEIKLRRPHEQASALYVYWNERAVMGTIHIDSGAAIRDGIKVINQYGHCEESHWPYDPAKFKVKPPQSCYDYARQHRTLVYESVPRDLQSLRECLAAGFPVIFGFTVHQSFESQQVAQSGFVPVPSWSDPALGGHAVLAIGYDDPAKLFLVRNSWGEQWGAAGNFLLPYDYMLSPEANDFWTLRVTR